MNDRGRDRAGGEKGGGSGRPGDPGTDDGGNGDPAAVYAAVREEVGRVLIGNEDAVEGLTIALLTRNHLLLEGVPGVAKTTIANLFARATGLEYGRVQMTPDILPSDITGTYVYREPTGEFELRKGPVFTNVLLADEINRATPKTQSALLEAMAERHATIEGETEPLPEPFMVVATMNPLEMEGVFSLPEAQRDRFGFKYVIDLPARDAERELLDLFDDSPELDPSRAEAVVTPAAILAAREAVAAVHVADPVKEYILDLVRATRDSPALAHGGSPRASLALLSGGKARAAIRGRTYVIPDDVKALAAPALRHRVIRGTDAELGGRTADDIVADAVGTVPAPSGALAPGEAETKAESEPGPEPEPEAKAETETEAEAGAGTGTDPEPDPEPDPDPEPESGTPVED